MGFSAEIIGDRLVVKCPVSTTFSFLTFKQGPLELKSVLVGVPHWFMTPFTKLVIINSGRTLVT